MRNGEPSELGPISFTLGRFDLCRRILRPHMARVIFRQLAPFVSKTHPTRQLASKRFQLQGYNFSLCLYY